MKLELSWQSEEANRPAGEHSKCPARSMNVLGRVGPKRIQAPFECQQLMASCNRTQSASGMQELKQTRELGVGDVSKARASAKQEEYEEEFLR